MMQKHPKKLYGSSKFPVAIADVVEVAVDIPAAAPIMARNTGMCFSLGSFDEWRLGEALAFLRGIGFVVQEITGSRTVDDFGFLTIKFAQVDDPRIKKPL